MTIHSGTKIKFRKRKVPSTVDGDSDGNKQFCSIGHMRFAYEITIETQPPTPTATPPSSPSSSPSAAASNVVDCSKFVSSWFLTGRRGRKGTSSTTSTATAVDVISSDQLNTKSYSTTSSSTSTATAVDVISTDQLNTKRVKIEAHADHKKKVHSNEKKNGVLEKEYKCNICSKVFTSPRALGGHKSSHYKANKTDTAIKKETTTFEPKISMSLDSSTDQTNQRTLIDFDLNELPPDDRNNS